MDHEIVFFLNGIQNNSPEVAFFVNIGAQWLVVAIPLAVFSFEYFFGHRPLRTLVVALLSAILGMASAAALAFIFSTPRPYLTYSDTIVPLFFPINPLGSFPSGHTSFMAAFSFALILQRRFIGLVCLLGTFIIGIARVAAGVHYPSDILAGLAVGLVVAFVAVRFSEWFKEEEKVGMPVTPMH